MADSANLIRPVQTEKIQTRQNLEQQRVAIKEAGASDRAVAGESNLKLAAKALGTSAAIVLSGGLVLLTGCPAPIDPPASEGEGEGELPIAGEGEGEGELPIAGEGEGEGEGEPVQTSGVPLKSIDLKSVVVDETGTEVVIGSGEFYVGERPGIESDLRVNCGFDFPKMEHQDAFALIQGITPDQVPTKYDNNVKYIAVGMDGNIVGNRVNVDDQAGNADYPELGTKTYAVYCNPAEDVTLLPGNGTYFTNAAFVRADVDDPNYEPNEALGTGKFGDPALVIDADPEVQGQFFLWSGYAFRGNFNNPADESTRRIYTQTIDKDFATNTTAPEEGRYINAYQNCISTIPFSTDADSTYKGLIGYRPEAGLDVILKNPAAYQASFSPDNLIIDLLGKTMEASPAGFPEITASNIADILAEMVNGVPKVYWVNESLDTMPNDWAGGKVGLSVVTKPGSGHVYFSNILGIGIPETGVGFVPGARSFSQNTKVLDVPVEPVTP